MWGEEANSPSERPDIQPCQTEYASPNAGFTLSAIPVSKNALVEEVAFTINPSGLRMLLI
jgi:hypothetical protein